MTDSITLDLEGYIKNLEAEVAKLRAQLPSEMQDCTIQFKECEVGHGRLTATNWIDHGCPHCTIAKLRAALEVTDEMADRALRAYHTWGGAPAWKPHDDLDYQGCIAQMRTALMAALNEETK